MNSCSASAAALKTAQSQLGMAINHTRQHGRPIEHALHCTITDLALCTASAQHICYLKKSLTTVPLYTYLILNPSVTPNPDNNTNSVLNQFAGGPPRSRINIYARARAGPQQQTRRPPLLLSIDRTDRRTDGHSTVS